MTINDLTNLTTDQLNALAEIMDDDTREQVHSEIAPCTPQEFLNRYLELDPAFGEITQW